MFMKLEIDQEKGELVLVFYCNFKTEFSIRAFQQIILLILIKLRKQIISNLTRELICNKEMKQIDKKESTNRDLY